MANDDLDRTHERWARLRFSIVGRLLAAPPERGDLREELRRLAGCEWRHPITGRPVRFGVSTIERWYYAARAEKVDPVHVLERRVRKDSGLQPSITDRLRRLLGEQYRRHRRWSYKLHRDNLLSLARQEVSLQPVPSYPTLFRYMRSHGMLPQKRLRPKNTPGAILAQERFESREVRSFEAEYVHGLWHLDYHQGSHKVITPAGEWVAPHLLAIMDDHSRLVCHAQWYLAETAENLVHGLCQAFLKRSLPRALMTDNGSAMTAAETKQGLHRLGVLHQTTLPYSPHQNGKQESFWGQVEGRLLAMLESCPDLTLARLNEATQAWIELEYNREIHSGTGQPPVVRFQQSPGVGRDCPSPDDLRLAFCVERSRLQRRSDGTITLVGVRFEIPNRYRHLLRIAVRYAGWDLTRAHMVDARTGTVLARIYPLDKARNADGCRRSLDPPVINPVPDQDATPDDGMAPLLRELIREYAATGLPPAYLAKEES
ncbi:transposase family protein [candidate division WOR-3 bacterium]|uniref:Transposase family protein n=1 Tax=candidate division WOR-3 bacterium TaxID=2052148 RepID=A0A937XGS2_UNCW3|nr:transposase family protein [candidate division WOR-3 bacterium]